MPSKTSFRPITRQLIISIVVVSTLITTVITAVMFYKDYSKEIELLNVKFEDIRQNHLGIIEGHFNNDNPHDQVAEQLNSILKDEDFFDIYITNSLGKVDFHFQKETIERRYIIHKSYLLKIDKEEQKSNVRRLHVLATKSHLLQRLFKKALFTFISQGVKTFIVVLFMLAIFHIYITGHLKKTSNYLQNLNLSAPDNENQLLQLNKSSSYRNEFDVLATSINYLVRSVQEKGQEQSARRKESEQIFENQELEMMSEIKTGAIRDITNNVAHDISVPITILSDINYRIKAALESPLNDSTVKQLLPYIDKIEKSVNKMQTITKELEMFISAADSPIEEVLLNDVLEDVLSLYMPRMTNHGITVSTNLDKLTDQIVVKCRKAEIFQVFVNLVTSSCRNVEGIEDAQIHLMLKPKADYVKFSISENGPTMSEKEKENLFDLNVTSKNGKMTIETSHIALKLSKEIVKNYGGKLYLDDDTEYTTFVVTLPLSKGQETAGKKNEEQTT